MRIKQNIVTPPKTWKDRVVSLFIYGGKIMKIKNYLFNHEASVLWGSTKDVKRGNPKNRRKNKNAITT